MAQLNEEMRILVHKEREAYEEESQRAEIELEKLKKSYEGKQKLIKNRLILAIGASENMNLEEAVKVASDMLIGAKQNNFRT